MEIIIKPPYIKTFERILKLFACLFKRLHLKISSDKFELRGTNQNNSNVMCMYLHKCFYNIKEDTNKEDYIIGTVNAKNFYNCIYNNSSARHLSAIVNCENTIKKNREDGIINSKESGNCEHDSDSENRGNYNNSRINLSELILKMNKENSKSLEIKIRLCGCYSYLAAELKIEVDETYPPIKCKYKNESIIQIEPAVFLYATRAISNVQNVSLQNGDESLTVSSIETAGLSFGVENSKKEPFFYSNKNVSIPSYRTKYFFKNKTFDDYNIAVPVKYLNTSVKFFCDMNLSCLFTTKNFKDDITLYFGGITSTILDINRKQIQNARNEDFNKFQKRSDESQNKECEVTSMSIREDYENSFVGYIPYGEHADDYSISSESSDEESEFYEFSEITPYIHDTKKINEILTGFIYIPAVITISLSLDEPENQKNNMQSISSYAPNTNCDLSLVQNKIPTDFTSIMNQRNDEQRRINRRSEKTENENVYRRSEIRVDESQRKEEEIRIINYKNIDEFDEIDVDEIKESFEKLSEYDKAEEPIIQYSSEENSKKNSNKKQTKINLMDEHTTPSSIHTEENLNVENARRKRNKILQNTEQENSYYETYVRSGSEVNSVSKNIVKQIQKDGPLFTSIEKKIEREKERESLHNNNNNNRGEIRRSEYNQMHEVEGLFEKNKRKYVDTINKKYNCYEKLNTDENSKKENRMFENVNASRFPRTEDYYSAKEYSEEEYENESMKSPQQKKIRKCDDPFSIIEEYIVYDNNTHSHSGTGKSSEIGSDFSLSQACTPQRIAYPRKFLDNDNSPSNRQHDAFYCSNEIMSKYLENNISEPAQMNFSDNEQKGRYLDSYEEKDTNWSAYNKKYRSQDHMEVMRNRVSKKRRSNSVNRSRDHKEEKPKEPIPVMKMDFCNFFINRRNEIKKRRASSFEQPSNPMEEMYNVSNKKKNNSIAYEEPSMEKLETSFQNINNENINSQNFHPYAGLKVFKQNNIDISFDTSMEREILRDYAKSRINNYPQQRNLNGY